MNRQILETVGAFALALIAGVGIFVFGYMVGGGFPCAGVEAKPKYGHYWSGLDSDEYHQLWLYLQSGPEPEPLPILSQSQCEKILLQLLVERYENGASEKSGSF